MIRGKAILTTYRTGYALFGAALLSTLLGSTIYAQAQKASPLDAITPEYLIGDAVSLSNQDYPEIEKAIQRFRNNDAEGANEFLKNAVEKYPKLPPAQVLFARMNLAIRNQQALRVALFWLDRAVAEVPDDPEAYLILADQAFSSNRTTDAQALFEYAAPLVEKYEANTKRKNKFNIRILAGRAAVAQRRAKWEEALKWLQLWVESDPESALAHHRLGQTLFNLEKPREALEEFTKSHEFDTKNSTAHPYVSLGQHFSAAGDVEKARKAFERAYSEDKADEKVAQAFVNWLIAQDDLEEAQAIMKALREQKPALQSALMFDGILDVMQGNRETAIKTLTEILSLDPSNSQATNLLALLLIESDDSAEQQKALSHAQVNAQRFADSSIANVTQGWVLYRLGRQSEAQQYLKKVQQNTLTQDAFYLLARMMVENGNKEQAANTLEAIINSKKAAVFIFRRDAEKLFAELKSQG